jgi:hypothetical protein
MALGFHLPIRRGIRVKTDYLQAADHCIAAIHVDTYRLAALDYLISFPLR